MCCHIDTNVDGYDREDEARRRNEYIENTLKEAEQGWLTVNQFYIKIYCFL